MENKVRYRVYQVDELNYGNGVVNTKKQLLRITYAKSSQQAINNVRFSLNITPDSLFCPYGSGGYRKSHLVAELV